MRSSHSRDFSTARVSAGAIVADAEDAEKSKARGEHQRVVLRDEEVLENRHAGEQADVLEGAGNPGAPGDVVAGHALEQDIPCRRDA